MAARGSSQYQIIEPIKSGHFGDVIKARHKYLGRIDAVKLLSTTHVVDPEGLLKEAEMMAALPDHENVVRVYDAGVWDDDTVYIATEMCTGGSLDDLATAPMDPATACDHAAAIARGLDHVHGRGLLHLDVRPANALIGADGHVKLVDFGLSRWVHSPEIDLWYLPHAAPELQESGAATQATDVYAAAMTLGHLLTAGSICADPPTGSSFLEACIKGKWPRLDQLGSHVPKRLRKTIKDSTAYLESNRPRTARALKARIDNAAPAVSFAPVSPTYFASRDCIWTIEMTEDKAGHQVTVRKNNRRVGDLGSTHATRRDAEKAFTARIESFAKR